MGDLQTMKAPILALALLALPAQAKEPVLNLPIDCTLGQSCYVQNFVDTDPSAGAADFTCGSLSYDGHKGTDFALPTTVDLWKGVDVLSAAPGTVIATRDGMEDFPQGTEGAPDITGRECGNGVVIDHGAGWTSQYCHMMNGSIAVQKGQKAPKGAPLGKVGLSGQTEFPHVHFVLRKDGKVIDPFNPDGVISCGAPAPTGTLWQDPLIYQPGGILSVGVATAMPSYEAVKSGAAAETRFTDESPALVVFGFAFGGRAGDVMRLSLGGPQGSLVDQDIPLDKNQAQFFRGLGKKRSAPWPEGDYSGFVQMIRDGVVIDRRQVDFTVKTP